MFRTPEEGFFPDFLRAQNIVRVTEGKITVTQKSRGNQFWFQLARGSSWRGFELSRVDCSYKRVT